MTMTHDPTQSYATLGGYPGVTPFGLPYGALQTLGIHPALANPFAQTLGIPPAYSGYQNPFWQNPFITAGVQNPQVYAGLHNPMLQNPVLQQLLQSQYQQNPQFQQNPMLQNPFVNPIQAQLLAHAQQLALQPYAAHLGGASPFGGQGSPYGQIGSPFGQGGQPWTQAISPLAPQTWVGQGGYGQGQSIQPHALAQFAGRGFQTPGISPWGF